MSQIEANNFSVELIFKLLEKTFNKGSKSEDIKEAQTKLLEMDKHILENFKLILEGIAMKDAFNEDLKLSALIYLKNTIEGKLKNKKLPEEHIWIIIKHFIDFLISSELSETIINNTTTLLQGLFNYKKISKNFSAIVDLFSMLSNFLKTQLDQNSNEDESFDIGIFKRLISLLQMLFPTKSINSKNCDQVFNLTLDIMDMILLKNQKILSNIIPKIRNANDLINKFDIHRLILELMFIATLKIKDFENSYQKIEILTSKYAHTCLNFIIDQSIPNNNLIIYITQEEELDKVLNLLKAKSFQMISAIIQYGSIEIKNTTIKEICYSLIDYIIKNLNFLVSQNLFNLEKYDKNIDLLLYHIFLFLSRCLNREPILSNFSPHVKKFIIQTLFPLMIATEKEKVNMKAEGEEYQIYIQDIIGEHKSKSSRTSIDFLLIRICDKYDGLASFVINFCIQMLDFAIKSTEIAFTINSQIPESYDLLNNSAYEFQTILCFFNQESLIDVAIILLCSLKNHIIKNKTYIYKLKFIFDSYIDQLHLVASDLIKFDICLIYEFFLSSLMENSSLQNTDLQNLTKRLDFLFVCLANYESNPGTSAQAAKAIINIFKEINIDLIDSDYLSNAFNQLIKHIEIIDIAIFFDVLIEILDNCVIEDYLIKAISFSTKRILKEIKSPTFDSPDKYNHVIFSKCINIIKTIIKDNPIDDNIESNENENNHIITTDKNSLNIDEIELILQPLMNYLKNPKKISFEDELLDILKLILINCNRTTNLSQELFGHLHKCLEKSEEMDMLLFRIFNLYIIKDNGFIFQNENNLQSLVNSLFKALEYNETSTFSSICGSILMQILPNNKLNAQLPETVISKIIQEMMSKITFLNCVYVNDYDKMNGTMHMHQINSFITTIYSYLIKYPELTYRILNERCFFQTLIQLTDLINFFNYFSTHQSKIVILGICSILSCDQIIFEINPLLSKILTQLFSLLYRQKTEEALKMKKMLNKEFDCNFVDSDDEEIGDNAEDQQDEMDTELMEYKQAIKNLKKAKDDIYDQLGFMDGSKKFTKLVQIASNPANEFDEYDIFAKIIYKLKNSQNSIFQEWENSLEDNHKTFWNEILHTRRINLSLENKMTFNVPRRILKIKRTFKPE